MTVLNRGSDKSAIFMLKRSIKRVNVHFKMDDEQDKLIIRVTHAKREREREKKREKKVVITINAQCNLQLALCDKLHVSMKSARDSSTHMTLLGGEGTPLTHSSIFNQSNAALLLVRTYQHPRSSELSLSPFRIKRAKH